MNVLVFDDKDLDRASLMARTLAGDPVSITVSHNGGYYDADKKPTRKPETVSLAFVHEKDIVAFGRSEWSLVCAVSYSGGGGADIPRQMRDGFTAPEAGHIRSELAKGDVIELRARILGYWGACPEKYALRLLCEAWILNGGKAYVKHGGVDVHAPVSAMDWFASFCSPEASSEQAERIAGMTGDAHAETNTLLQTVLERKDCAGPVRVLLNKLRGQV